MQEFDGPLAEFVALRQEILQRISTQQLILSLQLTLIGAIFGFSISHPNIIGILLIVPFGSYLLCGRLVSQHFGILQVADYIREELSYKVPGGLMWEEWLARQRVHRLHFFGSTLPLLLTFVGTSVLALGWTTAFVFTNAAMTVAGHVGLILTWTVASATSGLSAILILQMAGRLPAYKWAQVGPS